MIAERHDASLQPNKNQEEVLVKRLYVMLAIVVAVTAMTARADTGIAGMVYDAETMEPVVGARVMAMHGGMTYTDSTGAYLLDLRQAGDFVVHATAYGYEPAVFPDTVHVEEGQLVEGIDFALVPDSVVETGSISGTVTDAVTGEPIVLARVHTMHRLEAFTDSTGDYTIEEVPAGVYVVHAAAEGYEPADYPDTLYIEAGQVVEDIDFALEPAAACSMGYITGEVTGSLRGEIIRGALVTAATDGYENQVTQGCHGYRVAVPAGRYWVSATAPGYEPGAYGDSVDVVAGQATGDIDFVLGGGNPGEYGSIAGTVTDGATGDPLLGANVIAEGPIRAHDNADEAGDYLIEWLVPGSYVVTARMRGFLPAPPETVDVAAGQAIEDLDFALEPCSSRVEFGYVTGTVTDDSTGDPVPLAMVMGRGPVGQRGTRADSQGVYLLALRPGPYLVRACAREYLPSVYPETVWVTVDDTITGIDFQLEHVLQLRAAIGGWVYDSYSQEELAGAEVTAIGPDGSYQATTGEWGEYLFSDVEPGDYRITVNRTGYEPLVYRQLVTVESDEVEGYSTPGIYPLTGIQETPAARTVQRLDVAPSLFNLSSTVRYAVPVAGHVSLKVTDLAGRVVATLQNGTLSAGRYEATWNGSDANGRRLAGGVYFYRLEAPGLRAYEKVVLTAR